MERHPAGQLEVGGGRLARRPVESVADDVEGDRQVVHQAERADGVPCPLGAHEPADEQQPHRLAGPPSPVDRRRELVDAGLAHHLEPPHRHGGQEVLDVRGDPEHAARLLVRAAEQRVAPDAQAVQAPQAHIPGGRVLPGVEACRGLEAAPDRPHDERDAQPGGRGRVAHRDRDRLVREVEPLSPGLGLPDPPPGPEVEGQVAGLQHAVEPFRPAEAGRLGPLDDPAAGELGRDGAAPALVVRQQGDVVPAGQAAGPLVGDPRLPDVVAVTRRRDQQQLEHELTVSVVRCRGPGEAPAWLHL